MNSLLSKKILCSTVLLLGAGFAASLFGQFYRPSNVIRKVEDTATDVINYPDKDSQLIEYGSEPWDDAKDIGHEDDSDLDQGKLHMMQKEVMARVDKLRMIDLFAIATSPDNKVENDIFRKLSRNKHMLMVSADAFFDAIQKNEALGGDFYPVFGAKDHGHSKDWGHGHGRGRDWGHGHGKNWRHQHKKGWGHGKGNWKHGGHGGIKGNYHKVIKSYRMFINNAPVWLIQEYKLKDVPGLNKHHNMHRL